LKHGTELFKSPQEEGVTITYLARRNRFIPVEPTESLFKVAELLTLPGVRRIPVVENGKVINIISPSTIIQLLANELQEDTVNRVGPTVDELGIGTHSNLADVHDSSSVITAFKLMDEKKYLVLLYLMRMAV